MRQFAVRAQHGVIGFAPVRALISTSVTAAWPRQARVSLRLVAPGDPACEPADRQERRTAAAWAREPGPSLHREHRERVVNRFREVGRAWLDQVGPCLVDIVDAAALDEGSLLFLDTLVALSGGKVTVRCPSSAATAGLLLESGALTPGERRIERLADRAGRDAERLADEEVDFLYARAVGYLRTGDGWTAERILQVVRRQRSTPAVRGGLRLARALLGPPEDDRLRTRTLTASHAMVGHGPPLRLHEGWELLERWSGSAGQIDKNAVHKALFAIADRTVFRTYRTFDIPGRPLDFYVLVRERLLLRIRVHRLDAFTIAHVGSVAETPEVDLGTGRAV
ncbi:DUF6235 family protein [Streptomyces sp. NPDC057638]|uniref:DUF6235 family protein n=1 Tax=Streptomyces sp. NPDC057638 TaxID=3346190 RepID=UPI00368DBC03